MQQQRLSSQDAAAEAVVPGCSSRGCRPRMQQGVTAEDMILLLASMGEYFVLPLLDMRCPLWPLTLQHDVMKPKDSLVCRSCPPRMQQQRLSSQDAAAEAVLPGCSRRGCPPRMQQGVTAENPEM
ncbi:hypothetical protein CesoFtcFv8_000692 [Champsocephalus esox]|uniref:Uncharacterized protein n=1 Tax=Champsocephalus esox TaxID=159716 RepID=A0AAN8D253_9TELE|nr:hypothetical protein CesoFtcFv8_000692 [Champsocephalus esox]